MLTYACLSAAFREGQEQEAQSSEHEEQEQEEQEDKQEEGEEEGGGDDEEEAAHLVIDSGVVTAADEIRNKGNRMFLVIVAPSSSFSAFAHPECWHIGWILR